MKKAIIVILAMLYITVTSGVAVNIHYCMGDIASVEYGYDDHDVCGKCGMKESAKKKSCCHTEFRLVKLQDAHQLVKANAQLIEAPVAILTQSLLLNYLVPAQETSIPYATHTPPDKQVDPVYLLNCVFRI